MWAAVSSLALGAALSLRGLEHRPCLYTTPRAAQRVFSHFPPMADLCSWMYGHGLKKKNKKFLRLKRNTTGCLCCLNPSSFVSCFCWENGAGNWEAAPSKGFQDSPSALVEQPLHSLLKCSHQCKVQMRSINCLI